jgi:hypothetical protein
MLVAVPLALGLAACGERQAAPTADSQKIAARLDSTTLLPAMKAAFAQQKTWHIDGRMTSGGDTLLTIEGVGQAEPPTLSMELSGSAVGGDSAKLVLTGGRLYLRMADVAPDGKYLAVEADDPALGESPADVRPQRR